MTDGHTVTLYRYAPILTDCSNHDTALTRFTERQRFWVAG